RAEPGGAELAGQHFAVETRDGRVEAGADRQRRGQRGRAYAGPSDPRRPVRGLDTRQPELGGDVAHLRLLAYGRGREEAKLFLQRAEPVEYEAGATLGRMGWIAPRLAFGLGC